MPVRENRESMAVAIDLGVCTWSKHSGRVPRPIKCHSTASDSPRLKGGRQARDPRLPAESVKIQTAGDIVHNQSISCRRGTRDQPVLL